MNFKALVSVLLASAGCVYSQDLPASTAGFDLHALDSSVSPCADFYQYSCGTWLKNNPIPADQSSWGRFSELAERNRAILRNILEKAAVESAPAVRNPIDKQIGDYYASCMDEAAIEKKGAGPLKAELDRIAAMQRLDLVPEIARLHALGVDVFFNFSSGQDFKDSTEVIGQADQGGLGLPERDYYFKTDAESVATRQKYVAHLQKMFELMGNAHDAAAKAKVAMTVETAIAKASQDVVTRRDPKKIYHRIGLDALQKLTPDLTWSRYLGDLHAPAIQSLNVVSPEFYQSLNAILKSTSMADIKTYLQWHYAHAEAPLLSKAFVDENFEFYSKALTGAKEQRPRWKRCVAFTDNELGEALGRRYVDETFGADGKDRTLKMVRALEQSLGEDIQKLDWMTPATKTKALEKLHAITNKIGYPEKWRDYSSVSIVRGDAMGNSERATKFEFARQVAKIGKPVDRLEWQMTPPTVNAYYDPQMNNINFPAGILQPPFFDKSLDDAVNFGAIGAVIGHELTHGFDDQGRQFDPQGNMNDWWSPKDADAFETRAQCFVDEYGGFTAVGDLKLNGKLTLGENTADNGGLRIAYMALMNTLGGKMPAKTDGFTAQQRFFLGWGQIWCDNARDEVKRLRAQTDPHSIDKERVNGTVSNMVEFQQAFGCKEGQAMVRPKACRVW